MPKTQLPISIVRSEEEVVVSAGVAIDAYYFIRAGLTRAAQQAHGNVVEGDDPPQMTRHISGRQLCEGLRDIAIERWGLMTPAVLAAWGVYCTLDFGKIVYALIDKDLFQKQPHDRLEDFANVYDFRRTFVNDYRIALPKAIS